MDVLNHIFIGFSVALAPANLLYCFIGVLIGTLVGVLPGLGPVAAMSLLLPATFHTTPEASIIMLAGIYYGSMYGGSTTSILVNIPGEAASVITCIDGYQMARKGRAGAALGIAAFGSFIAGTVGIIGFTMDKVSVRLSNVMAFDGDLFGNWGCKPEYYPAVVEKVLRGKIDLMSNIEEHPLDSINEITRLAFDHKLSKRVIFVP